MLVASEFGLRYWYRHVQSGGNAGGYFAQARQIEIARNSLGYRDREVGPKDPSRYRIAVIGDSFTWGQGIEAKERFSNLIEALLGPRYEVLNFGIPGHDMPQHLQVLEQVLPLAPDFVLLQLYINDFETAAMQRPKPRPLISDAAARGWGRSSVLYDMANGHPGGRSPTAERHRARRTRSSRSACCGSSWRRRKALPSASASCSFR